MNDVITSVGQSLNWPNPLKPATSNLGSFIEVARPLVLGDILFYFCHKIKTIYEDKRRVHVHEQSRFPFPFQESTE